ncbi:DUF5067 domain-containing protein [Tetzosporium hominis]|uniref:DUF5067 domain-containing protein n=1 Tax=Tetzosporium hominis TaxID=2020506 RepID=A0A264W064_9BACL|nr:DUF5067 domain-containing protein [Tetzosporium hominis]OZS76970.1 DUF5067 domain-containing protein [Tetzosporium hominis]
MKNSLFLLFIVLLLTACGSQDATNDKETKGTEEVAAEIDKEKEEENIKVDEDVYFKDNEAKLNDIKINITETKIINPGDPGNEYGEKPAFAIWYETTNLSDKDIDPMTAWIVVFTAIQDNDPNAINELNVGMLPDDSFLDSQMESIKKNGTVKNAIAYELDDLETPVTLVANQGVGGEELGRQDFNVK